MQLTFLFISFLESLLPFSARNEVVCFQNKSLGNWQEDQRMKSVIWKVVCMLERFLHKSLHFPGSNIKSYSEGQAIFFGFSSKQEFGASPVVTLIRIYCLTASQLLGCKMIIFSSKLDSSFQPPQMALMHTVPVSYIRNAYWFSYSLFCLLECESIGLI